MLSEKHDVKLKAEKKKSGCVLKLSLCYLLILNLLTDLLFKDRDWVGAEGQ